MNFSKLRLRAFCLFALAGVTACTTGSEPPEVLLWEGTLIPVQSTSLLSGSVAMVSNAFTTQIGIGVQNATPQARLGWSVRDGSCQNPGERIGPANAFPPMIVTVDGNATSETMLNRRVTASTFAGALVADPDGSAQVVACAQLARTR